MGSAASSVGKGETQNSPQHMTFGIPALDLMGSASSAGKGIPGLDLSFGFDDANFSDRTLLLEIDDTTQTSRVRTIHICSLILAGRSGFFRKLFSNGMRESEQKHATLRIEALDKFEVDSCVRDCTQSLQNLPMTCESASTYLDLPSSLVTIQPLIDAAKQFLVAHYKELDKFKDEVLNLSLVGIQAVLCSDDLVVTSEYVVYDLVLRWAHKHYPVEKERREILKTYLLKLVRFPLMTTIELIEEVQTCIDINPEFAFKIAFDALSYKTGNLCQKHPLIAEEGNTTSRQFVKRAYKHRPVTVVEFKLPHQHCIVYFDITRKEMTNIYPKGQIRSETFHLGGLELYFLFECSVFFGLHYFWLSLNNKGSTTNTVKYKIALRVKPTKDFVSWIQGSLSPGTKHGTKHKYKWKHFIDDILHLRFELTLKNN